MKRKFAVFDIDGTIGRHSLFIEIVHLLVDQKHLPLEFEHELRSRHEDYKQRTHNDAFKDYEGTTVKILFENIKDLPVSDYKKAVDTVVSQIKLYNHVYTRDLVKKLKSDGYFLIALSGSEMYAVQEYTKQFNFDIAVGEYYHEKNNRFTGKIDQVFHKKDKFVKEIVKDNNLSYEGSIAIGDSMGDLGMLEIVESPIAFNPEDRLYNHAKKMGWKIVVERKNVIYELGQDDGKYILA